MRNKVTLEIPDKLLPLLTVQKRFKVVIGGRGSAKSVTVAKIMASKVSSEKCRVVAGREYQNTIEDSVHEVIKGQIELLGMLGFTATDKKIRHAGGGDILYRGFARNPAGIKSLEKAKYAWIEEAQTLSAESIQELTPTIRLAGGEIWFTANPKNSKDPFSQRFIKPFEKELKAKGYYEDDLHLIIFINYVDNPWFNETELPAERQYDFEHKPRALYNHIWLGDYNDTVDNAIIQPEWFDACVDAHVKLNIDPKGIEVVCHDPSDQTNEAGKTDPKGLCYRHGILVKECMEKTIKGINEGGDWASEYVNDLATVDQFIWDGDGMGVGLRRQFNKDFLDKRIILEMFRGSNGPDRPDEIYEAGKDRQQKTNKQAFKNKRAQYYWYLRDRCYNTYLAVVKGQYINPAEIISFSSDIEALPLLRSELCTVPLKPNPLGYIQILSKDEMKKMKIESPNMADCVMMSFAVRPPAMLTRARREVTNSEAEGWT